MENTVKQLKALADGNRLRVVMALAEYGELCVCQITEFLGVAMGTVSRHMSVLQGAALVKSRKDARWVYYRLAPDFPPELLTWLKASVSESDTEAMLADKEKLETILTQPVDELCRVQKQR